MTIPVDRQLSFLKFLETIFIKTKNALQRSDDIHLDEDRLQACTRREWISAMPKVHNALIKLNYSPVISWLSRSSEKQLQRFVARGLRCSGVPRETSSSLVISEARHPSFPVTRRVETCGHFFFFCVSVQQAKHPLAITLND